MLGVGCWIGGATKAQIEAGLPEGHRCYGATQLEAHHEVAEFAGLTEIDWEKVAADFPQAGIHTDEDFLRFAESEGGLSILCVPPDEPVFTQIGWRPAASIRTGDHVFGHDGQFHAVTATMRRPFNGELLEIDGSAMTGNHPVLTIDGWVRADRLATGQIVAKFGMLSPDVLSLRGVQPEVLQPIVIADTVEMMDSLGSGESAPQMLLHDPAVLHNLSVPIAVPYPEADIAAGRQCSAVRVGVMGSRECVERDESASVRTEPLASITAGALELSAALSTCEVGRMLQLSQTPEPRATFPGTSMRVMTRLWSNQIAAAAEFACLADTSGDVAGARWGPIRKIRAVQFRGDVHNISVADSQSFVIGNGLVIHNCDVHHRHAQRGIHAITYPVWKLDRYAKDGWEFLA